MGSMAQHIYQHHGSVMGYSAIVPWRRFCLGLTRLQGVAMSRDMLRCTSRNKQLNTRFDEVRNCALASLFHVTQLTGNDEFGHDL